MNKKNIDLTVNSLKDILLELKKNGYIKEDWIADSINIINEKIVECINKSTTPIGENATVEEKIKAIFRPFSLFPIKDTKVLIIGQDPYPETKKAQGLAFSCKTGKAHSLTKIFKAVDEYRNSKNKKHNYDLLNWATEYKILLLNSALTFEKSKLFEYKYKTDLSKEKQKKLKKDQQNIQNRHLKIWNDFIVSVIEKLIKENNNLVVFLWGNKANELFEKCRGNKTIKNVFRTCHPHKRLKNGEDDKFLKEVQKHFKKCDEEILIEEKIWQNL